MTFATAPAQRKIWHLRLFWCARAVCLWQAAFGCMLLPAEASHMFACCASHLRPLCAHGNTVAHLLPLDTNSVERCPPDMPLATIVLLSDQCIDTPDQLWRLGFNLSSLRGCFCSVDAAAIDATKQTTKSVQRQRLLLAAPEQAQPAQQRSHDLNNKDMMLSQCVWGAHRSATRLSHKAGQSDANAVMQTLLQHQPSPCKRAAPALAPLAAPRAWHFHLVLWNVQCVATD